MIFVYILLIGKSSINCQFSIANYFQLPEGNIPWTGVNAIPQLNATTLKHPNKSTLSRELYGGITCVEKNIECRIQSTFMIRFMIQQDSS